jgi:phage anti-repressor protein
MGVGVPAPALTAKEVAMFERKERSREEVALRAYELYLERGSEQGRDVEDWLGAEKS